jgi:hypothetical protein
MTDRIVRSTLAVALAIHGLVHLLGVMTAWRLSPFKDPPTSTAILDARLEVGADGMELMGLAWMFATAAVVIAAVALWIGGHRMLLRIAAGTLISLAVCLVGLPESNLGILIDVGILTAIIAAAAPFVRIATRSSIPLPGWSRPAIAAGHA